jgi:photosystem II stability/assembly factor-like uncharacterized protein
MEPKRALLAALCLALLPQVLCASEPTWEATGAPPGGDVRSLAHGADPRIAYLGTSEGILFRSEDAGQSWRRLEPGLPLRGVSLDNIAVSPSGDVFVAYWQVSGEGGGVARSSDGGRSFRVLRDIDGESVRALSIARSDPTRLVAGTLSGVFASRDAGESWRRISPRDHAELRNVESVAFDPENPETVYAGTWRLPWRTRDGGASWQRISAGMVFDSDVFSLTLDARVPETVYATACTGIYRSRDRGTRWAKIGGIPASARRTRAFAQDPERPGLLYAGTTEGLWVSEDAGGRWERRSSRELVVNALAILPGGVLLVGSDGAGVLRGSDAGRSLVPANGGFSARFVSRLVADAAGSRLLATVQSDRHHAGVLAAPRAEGPWTRLASGLEGREVTALAVAGREVFAGTDEGLFGLSPGGLWRPLAAEAAGAARRPRVAEVMGLAPSTLLAATDQGLLRSHDQGLTWETAALGPARSVEALVRAGRSVIAATPVGLYRSLDGGRQFAFHSQGPAGGRITRIEAFPGREDLLLAATRAGLFRSDDGGRSWVLCESLPIADIAGLALYPDGRTALAADFERGGLYRSQDAGASWVPFPTKGLMPERVWAILVDGAGPGTLVAATASGGLHVLRAGPGLAGQPPAEPPAQGR